MPSRRHFLAGLAASAGLATTGTWAAAGAPDFLSAARFPDGSYQLAGLTRTGEILFTLPLPDRGHAAAAHPRRAEAVAFARRPGDFALVIDCITGQDRARLTAPQGRHFYGHGVFTHDGARLYTTENDYEAGEGVIGVWDAQTLARLGEFPSGGVGPHDMVLLPDGQTLVVANGGIETHPSSGRAKLNIPVMEPNLSYLSLDGTLIERMELDRELHKNSIRHLAVGADGTVAFAMQWQGGDEVVPLLGLHAKDNAPSLLTPPADQLRRMNGYAGSVALSGDGKQVAITSPRGGLMQIHDLTTGALLAMPEQPDVCGIGTLADGFLFTTGEGVVGHADGDTVTELAHHDCQFDNHLVRLT
ncbi:DUF1513 domain-containing protein [Aliiroseovarius sp.]|uniref:DUF1513 domain-containing protein n=1 Tax=Aliiroseovarius sp. TaxID=1872442 RepID=UPI003BAD34D7